MTKQEILEQIKKVTHNNYLRLPEAMDMVDENGNLIITMTSKGLEDNMQNDSSAFEGWAITIKAIMPDVAGMVVIKWKGIGLGKGSTFNHYRRFLYRLIRFEESYEWVSYEPLDTQAYSDIKTVAAEIHNWVVNYPNSESISEAQKGEAHLERHLKDKLKEMFVTSDHQLPVGLFNMEKSEKNERTPGGKSQVDLWSLSGDTFTVYELKKDKNREVGIISELMFYVNVFKDLSEGIFHFSKGAEKSDFRSFKVLYEAVREHRINNVCGVFLTNDFHTIIQLGGTRVFRLLNDNSRHIEYKQTGFIVSEI